MKEAEVSLSLAVLNGKVVKMPAVTRGKGSVCPATAAQQEGKVTKGYAAVKVGLADDMQPQFYQLGEKAVKVICMVLS